MHDPDLQNRFEATPGVVVFDFRGARTTAINEAVLEELRTPAPTRNGIHGQHIRENRATRCLFDRDPLPPGLSSLRTRIYRALALYLIDHLPDAVGRPFRHRSWCNHYDPNEGVPWHNHAETPVVSISSIKGDGGDLIIQDPDISDVCHRIQTPPGRMIFMPGVLQHCSTPNFGPDETRVSLPVNFYFEN